MRVAQYFWLGRENAVALPIVRPACLSCGEPLSDRQPGASLLTRYCSHCFFRPKKFSTSELQGRIILPPQLELSRGAGPHRILPLGEKRQ